jgi:hypothetical protein
VTRLVKSLFLSCVISGLLSGCGSNAGDSSSLPSTQPLAVYNFSAIVSHVGNNFFLPIVVGDAVSGSFSYRPDATLSNNTSASTSYQQKSPAFVQIRLGSITLNSDLNPNTDGTGGYNIGVNNNYAAAGQPLDALYLSAKDTQVAASYGLASIGMTFSFLDITSTAMNNTALSGDIDINKFDFHKLNIYGNHDIQGLTTAQITSLTRIQ